MRKFLLLTCMLVLSGVALAQRTITGRVTDAEGKPLAGASILVQNTTAGTVTREDGTFSLFVPANGRVLIVSSVGLATQEIPIGTQTNVTITLREGAQANLQEVVVTALGITRDRRTLGYATQNIKSQEIVDKGDISLISALQGKIAGADIVTTGGAAGAPTTILLRGVASFTGSQSPLMVVDGIPISNDIDESTHSLGSNQSSNRAIDLNLNNIESVNVLAGPAAAALYGSRAKNGAIMITTKKGSGQRGLVNVTFNSSYTVQKVYGFPELQTKYGQGANQIFNPVSTSSFGPAFGSTPTLVNGLIVSPTANNPQNPQYVNGQIYTAGQTIPYQNFPNNIMSYFNTGTVFENSLSVNSGDAKTNYGITLANTSQGGILPNTKFDRTSIGFSGGNQFNERLSARVGATYFSTRQNSITQGASGSHSSYANVYAIPTSVDFDYYRNNYLTPGGYNNWFVPNTYSTVLQDTVSASDNPYFAANKNPVRSNTSRIMGNLTLGYDVTKWLNVSYRLGVDTYTDRRKRTIALGSSQVVRSVFSGTSGSATGGIMEDVFYRNELNGDLMISAKKNNILTNGLNATFLVGHGVNQRRFQQMNQTGYQLALPDYYNISNATNLSLTGEQNSIRRLWGIYGQMTLGYNNYLFLELTGRQDYSSTLPTNKNGYFYPSASVSFVLTDAFKIQSDVLSFAKVRLASAKVGNDAPPYFTNPVSYTTASAGNNVAFYNFPFGNVPGFQVSTQLGQAALTPEFISTTDLGLNIGLFKNRLNLDATIYNSISTSQIVRVGLPSSSGFTSIAANVGELTNKGVEITLNGTPVRGKNFTWDMKGTFSLNRNKVTKIAPGIESFNLGDNRYSGLIPTVALGEPFGVIRGAKYNRNANGELLIDSTTGRFAGYTLNQTVLDPNRDWIAGLTNTLQYKNFTFSFLVDHKQGGQMESFTQFSLRTRGALKMTEDREMPFILPGVIDMGGGKYRPNDIQISGRAFYLFGAGSQTGASDANEFAVVDATTFRLREVSFGYDLSGSKVNTKLFKNLRLTVYGRNLFFYAPNSLIDPELSTQTGNVRGLELGSAPGTRNIGASIRATF